MLPARATVATNRPTPRPTPMATVLVLFVGADTAVGEGFIVDACVELVVEADVVVGVAAVELEELVVDTVSPMVAAIDMPC